MMHGMRCDQCKSWDPEYSEWDHDAKNIGYGQCTAARERWVIMDEVEPRHYPTVGTEEEREARYKAICQERLDHLKASGFYVQDGSEYKAQLLTAPDFWCKAFNEKTGETNAKR